MTTSLHEISQSTQKLCTTPEEALRSKTMRKIFYALISDSVVEKKQFDTLQSIINRRISGYKLLGEEKDFISHMFDTHQEKIVDLIRQMKFTTQLGDRSSILIVDQGRGESYIGLDYIYSFLMNEIGDDEEDYDGYENDGDESNYKTTISKAEDSLVTLQDPNITPKQIVDIYNSLNWYDSDDRTNTIRNSILHHTKSPIYIKKDIEKQYLYKTEKSIYEVEIKNPLSLPLEDLLLIAENERDIEKIHIIAKQLYWAKTAPENIHIAKKYNLGEKYLEYALIDGLKGSILKEYAQYIGIEIDARDLTDSERGTRIKEAGRANGNGTVYNYNTLFTLEDITKKYGIELPIELVEEYINIKVLHILSKDLSSHDIRAFERFVSNVPITLPSTWIYKKGEVLLKDAIYYSKDSHKLRQNHEQIMKFINHIKEHINLYTEDNILHSLYQLNIHNILDILNIFSVCGLSLDYHKQVTIAEKNIQDRYICYMYDTGLALMKQYNITKERIKELILSKKSDNRGSASKFYWNLSRVDGLFETLNMYGITVDEIKKDILPHAVIQIKELIQNVSYDNAKQIIDNFALHYESDIIPFVQTLDVICSAKKESAESIKANIEQAKQLRNKQKKLEKMTAIESIEGYKNTPNIIICRRYQDTQHIDMNILTNNIPNLIPAITYLDNPNDISTYLVPGRKNIIFIGQYFDGTDKTGTETAKELKTLPYDTSIIGITSIDLSSNNQKALDEYFLISSKMSESDGGYMMLEYIKKYIGQIHNIHNN